MSHAERVSTGSFRWQTRIKRDTIFRMVTKMSLCRSFFTFGYLVLALAATGCGVEPDPLQKSDVVSSPSPISDQFNYQVQPATPATLQTSVMSRPAPSDAENQFRPLPNGDAFLLAATASRYVQAPVPTPAITSAQSLEEVSELIRQQVQERPVIAAGMNPFSSLSTTPRKP